MMLRPGWIEDAPELARAIGHESVVKNISRAPWPYALGDAEEFLAGWTDPMVSRFLILAHENAGVRIVGMIGVEPLEGAMHELGYWITPDAWGRGYATEAGRGVLAAVRAMGVRHIEAGHFLDNPASGKVLRKLGFKATGEVRQIHSRGRGTEAPCARYTLDMAAEKATGDDPDDVRMAA
ncbi:GNAT family N-acetyltransferase [Sphingosinithalassobacter tenebrarum]|uniref:GNAT family N-acetyltransferase n=1 Tax=Stakelama tenebrarum TaxID=2711215 RepID=A0A6G6YA96_9SPHN|nr:GNAT family N-acetyltransferase [Sphingosinithalassobacter tenebrarum]